MDAQHCDARDTSAQQWSDERLLVLGYDRENLERGVGGLQDADVLYDSDLLAAAAEQLEVERLDQVARAVGEATAVDTLLVARRPAP
jgi:hypothetical protein